jgi:hypothetical protein
MQAIENGCEIRPEWIISNDLLAILKTLPAELLAGDLAALMLHLPLNTHREEVVLYRKINHILPRTSDPS